MDQTFHIQKSSAGVWFEETIRLIPVWASSSAVVLLFEKVFTWHRLKIELHLVIIADLAEQVSKWVKDIIPFAFSPSWPMKSTGYIRSFSKSTCYWPICVIDPYTRSILSLTSLLVKSIKSFQWKCLSQHNFPFLLPSLENKFLIHWWDP